MKIDPNILNAFLTLMGSVAVLGILLYAMKKLTLKFKSKTHANELEIVSKLNLSPKNSLWTIKFQNKLLLIGVSEKNINLISEITNSNLSEKPSSTEIKSNNQAITSNKKKINNLNDDLSFKEFLKSAVFKNN